VAQAVEHPPSKCEAPNSSIREREREREKGKQKMFPVEGAEWIKPWKDEK
jgi:hypothetical protein